jgi:very-short-patch-repair endonuclease
VRRISDPFEEFLFQDATPSGAFILDLQKYWDTPKRWEIIRAYYKQVTPHILAGGRLDPYILGMADKMTPIEYALWQEIRYHGLPFFPQYPVGRRFVDFGDPVMKIAIEADGAAYHSKERDELRNHEIARQGWQVFHVRGRDALYARDALKEILEVYGVKQEEDPE